MKQQWVNRCEHIESYWENIHEKLIVMQKLAHPYFFGQRKKPKPNFSFFGLTLLSFQLYRIWPQLASPKVRAGINVKNDKQILMVGTKNVLDYNFFHVVYLRQKLLS